MGTVFDAERPVGERLGSETLYSQPLGESLGESLDPRTWLPRVVADDDDPPLERRDIPHPDAPERKDMPKPEHRDPRKRGKQPHREGGESQLGALQASLQRRNISSNCLEIAGMGLITTGSWQIAAWLGLIVAGLCLILLGVAIGVQRDT
jgi:hypothetical protein